MPLLEEGDFLALALGRLVSGIGYGSLPPRAVEIAKTGIADCLAVAVAGRDEEPVRALCLVLGTGTEGAESSIFGAAGPSARYPAPEAAWLNGTAGHVLDYDDVALGHPSVVIV
ncbi:MAG TPA: MmgE/PrpD family protein, partial [Burkholderiales bacterium]|nr:MmgE/PrpD family protein [Burkholderiales bacterium]